MPVSFHAFGRKALYFLVFALYTQALSSDLPPNRLKEPTSIKEIELEKRVDQLLLLIQKRLAIMHEVAKAKWNQNTPLEDKERERQILNDLANNARDYNLHPQWVSQFFQAQIEASKEMQKTDFAAWQKEGAIKFNEAFSLKDALRSYIDEINQEMIVVLSKIGQENFDLNKDFLLNQPISRRESDAIDQEIWLMAVLPLRKKG